jgi:hypothetical protein
MPTDDETQDNLIVLNDSALLQIHLAEYQSLTNRCNYWISVQMALLPLFLIVVGIVAQMWSGPFNRQVLLWGGMLSIQLIAMTWLQTGLEIYRVVFYLECRLRPLIGKPMMASQAFWRYEGFLAEQRSTKPLWQEYAMSLGNVLGVLSIIVFRWRLSMSDCIGLVPNTLFLIANIVYTWKLISVRRLFSKCVVC